REALSDCDSGIRRIAGEVLHSYKRDHYWRHGSRYLTTRMMDEIGTDAAVSALLDALCDGDSEVRRVAAVELGKIGSEAAASALRDSFLVDRFSTYDYDSRQRKHAAEALVKFCSDTPISFSALLDPLSDSDSGVRSNAVEDLVKICSDAAVSALEEDLRSKDVDDMHMDKLAALVKIGSDAVVCAFKDALSDSNPIRRSGAVKLTEEEMMIGPNLTASLNIYAGQPALGFNFGLYGEKNYQAISLPDCRAVRIFEKYDPRPSISQSLIKFFLVIVPIIIIVPLAGIYHDLSSIFRSMIRSLIRR
ncbi:MAG: HEAT repeat domain-containing protein, partial [Methylococcales bacterium]